MEMPCLWELCEENGQGLVTSLITFCLVLKRLGLKLYLCKVGYFSKCVPELSLTCFSRRCLSRVTLSLHWLLRNHFSHKAACKEEHMNTRESVLCKWNNAPILPVTFLSMSVGNIKLAQEFTPDWFAAPYIGALQGVTSSAVCLMECTCTGDVEGV